MSDPEKRIQELHLTLPPAPKPMAKYKTAVQAGNICLGLRQPPDRAGRRRRDNHILI